MWLSPIDTPTAPRFRPRLERLEDRRVLSHTPAGTAVEFVTALYEDVLEREPDSVGLDFWTDAIELGATPAEVAAGFWISEEHRLMQIDAYYAEYLGRDADASGRSFWLRQFQTGFTEAEVQLGFILSAEYQDMYPTDRAYVTALYEDVLDRAPDEDGLNTWLARLDAGFSRGEVAFGFLESLEELTQVVEAYYVEFFNRSADSTGLDTWVSALSNDVLTRSGVAVSLLSSEEYFLTCCA